MLYQLSYTRVDRLTHFVTTSAQMVGVGFEPT